MPERADFDRKVEQFSDDRALVAGERTADRKLEDRMIGRQQDQHADGLEAVGSAAGDHHGGAPIDRPAIFANRLVRDTAAEIGAPLIKVERQKEGVKPGQVALAES